MESYGNLWTVRSGAKTVIDLATQGVKVVTYIKSVCSQKTIEPGKPITTVSTRRIYKIGGAIMDKKFNSVMRSGKTIDMFSEIEDLQAQYSADLSASVQTYNTYEEVSNATYEDFLSVKMTISTFEMLGYLFKEEAADMIEAAHNERMEKLDALQNALAG